MACEQNNTIWKPLSDSLYLLRLITRQIQSIAEQSTVLKNQLHALHYGMYRDKDIEKMYARQIGLLQKNKKADLITACLFFVGKKFNINPVLYIRDKTIYQGEEDRRIRSRKRRWRLKRIERVVG